jgi:2-hydroxychromene-2-carboxylate isomerase
MPRLDFWYEFASTYSYLAAMRIEPLARKAGIEIVWRPFLLGPIFKAQGWDNSPFNLYSAKGKYMWRDLERTCAAENLRFRKPDPFPQPSLAAARIALAQAVAPLRAEFSRRVYLAEFADGLPIADEGVLSRILGDLSLEPCAVLAEARSEPIKSRLREETAEAMRLGIFGAPSFVTEESELFWGNDRLEAALAWAAQ